MNKLSTLQVAGTTVHYVIRFSKQARSLSLRIHPNTGVVIVVPYWYRSAGIDFEELLRTKSDWILKKLALLENMKNNLPAISFTDGSRLPFAGESITLRVIRVSGRKASVELEGRVLLVLTPDVEESRVKAIVTAWYKHAAKRIIPEHVSALNEAVRYSFARVIVRDQRSRWGSCSRRGTLSFNWRLLLLPAGVMDYLIHHELAHLKEMNHSVRFWRQVAAISPDYKESERWLKKNGRLMFW